MKFTRRKVMELTGAAALVTPTALRAQGGTVHEVQMLTRDEETGDSMVYKPAILQIEPGDTVRWVAASPSHNTASVEDGIPEGAETWNSDINDDFEMTFDVEGPYAYYCVPHSTAGMVGMLLVGQVDSLDPIREVRMRGRASQRWEEYLEEAEGMIGG